VSLRPEAAHVSLGLEAGITAVKEIAMSYQRQHRALQFARSVFALAIVAIFAPAACAQGTRQVTARYTVADTARGFVFADGGAKIEEPVVKGFQTALQGLTLTIYSDDTFDLQSGPGSFVFSFTGGRVGRTDGLLFLHLRSPASLLANISVDGILYPAGPDPATAPPRLSFAYVQEVLGGVLTWHSVATLKAAGTQ